MATSLKTCGHETVYAIYVTAENRAKAAVLMHDLLKGGIVEIAEKLDEMTTLWDFQDEPDLYEWDSDR